MREIVVVRLSSLGDVAMLVPVFLSFHEAYPDIQIRLITRERFAPIFKDLNFVTIVPINQGKRNISFKDLIHFTIQLSRTKPKIVLDMHDVLRTMILRATSRLFGSKIQVIDKGRAEKEALILLNADKSHWLKTTFQRYAEVFESVGFPFKLSPIFLNKSTKKSTKKQIGISPFAKHKSKEYSFANLKKLIYKLTSHSENQIFIFGYGDEERQIATDMACNRENVSVIIGEYSFSEELNLISSLDLMVSMDSGNGHLAANYGIPVITLWGTTHPKLGFGPYLQPISNSIFPDDKRYPSLPISIFGKCSDDKYSRAIDSIDANQVYQKIIEIIELQQ
jgi:ADP-heptose:LPS heptosyltransferase